MLPDHIPNLDRYYDLTEYFAFRTSLLILFIVGLYRLIKRELRK
jgi:hypothetical protein